MKSFEFRMKISEFEIRTSKFLILLLSFILTAPAFANRLASFTITPATPGGCSLTFTGLGQAQPTEDDKRDVRRFAGC